MLESAWAAKGGGKIEGFTSTALEWPERFLELSYFSFNGSSRGAQPGWRSGNGKAPGRPQDRPFRGQRSQGAARCGQGSKMPGRPGGSPARLGRKLLALLFPSIRSTFSSALASSISEPSECIDFQPNGTLMRKKVFGGGGSGPFGPVYRPATETRQRRPDLPTLELLSGPWNIAAAGGVSRRPLLLRSLKENQPVGTGALPLRRKEAAKVRLFLGLGPAPGRREEARRASDFPASTRATQGILREEFESGPKSTLASRKRSSPMVEHSRASEKRTERASFASKAEHRALPPTPFVEPPAISRNVSSTRRRIARKPEGSGTFSGDTLSVKSKTDSALYAVWAEKAEKNFSVYGHETSWEASEGRRPFKLRSVVKRVGLNDSKRFYPGQTADL
ncbi:hypothetical protein KM043_000964 [Ampulex compressa]|nr:hypothetical protein KM043_000964 [Ampulex compressa]